MTSNLEKIQGNAVFEPERPIFPISVVADILKVHQRTLRIYDDENILVPSRSLKNRRLYCFNDIEKGKFIQFLTKEIGINLAGIKIILNLLSQQSIAPEKSLEHITKIAKNLNISSEIQQENKTKLSRRGRKPRNNSTDCFHCE